MEIETSVAFSNLDYDISDSDGTTHGIADE
jgi:hypothetical protein